MAATPGDDEPAFCPLEPQMSLGSSAFGSGVQRAPLHHRRSTQKSIVLDMDTITKSSRDDTEHDTHADTAAFRGWQPTGPGTSMAALLDPVQSNPQALRVASYNVLAARYTSSDKYPFCPLWALAEPYRLRNIFRELQQMDPHIVVMQELSGDALRSAELGDSMRGAGFDSYHVPISTDRKERQTSNSGGSGNWGPSERGEHEGVGIFWRTDRFERQECLPVRFNSIAMMDKSLSEVEKRRLCINSHNVAALAVLRDVVTQKYVVVAGIHGFFDFAKPDCQLWQTVKLIEQIEVLLSTYSDIGDTAVIMAGDFNCEPHGQSVQYALRGTTATTAVQMECTRASQHNVQLESSYASYVAQEPRHVTASAGGFAGWIDYIFYQPASLRCVAVAKVAGAADIPTAQIPSDHYPVCSWFVPA